MIMKIYTYDSEKVYSGVFDVINPKAPVPAGLLDEPPVLIGTQVAQAVNGQWVVLPEYPSTDRPLVERQSAVWEQIKAERDKRKVSGVKVGSNWFHSDDSSRIQQLALVMMGASVPPGLMWKVLTLTPPPVFVEMTPALAGQIFQATAASDAAIFGVAETHRLAMEASQEPENYDFSTGWPVAIWEE